MEQRKSSAPSNLANNDSIPIKVIHEKHKVPATHSRTADLPKPSQSPRVTRAHSEPPKAFNQRLLKTKIPLGGDISEQNELATSASDSAVPHSESHKSAAESAENQPSVRHIPIRVEGREEPVLNTENNLNRKPEKVPERRAQQPPTTLKVNNNGSAKNTEPTSPLSPIPSDQPIPMGYTETDNAKMNGLEPTSPLALPEGPIPLPFVTPTPKEEIKPKVPINPDDPCLNKLAKIMDNVHDLERQLDNFRGDKNSKDYRFLDEMLTRNLLALDGIETAGREDVRQQRKESIKSINRCLSILESKAKSNQAEKNNEILSDLAKQN